MGLARSASAAAALEGPEEQLLRSSGLDRFTTETTEKPVLHRVGRHEEITVMDLLKRQIRAEADRIAETDRRLGLEDNVPRDERIEHQPRDLYAPPLFLSKTTTREARERLTDLLERLWQINEENAGATTREADQRGERQRGEHRPGACCAWLGC
jgi:hypothetical protein